MIPIDPFSRLPMITAARACPARQALSSRRPNCIPNPRGYSPRTEKGIHSWCGHCASPSVRWLDQFRPTGYTNKLPTEVYIPTPKIIRTQSIMGWLHITLYFHINADNHNVRRGRKIRAREVAMGYDHFTLSLELNLTTITNTVRENLYHERFTSTLRQALFWVKEVKTNRTARVWIKSQGCNTHILNPPRVQTSCCSRNGWHGRSLP